MQRVGRYNRIHRTISTFQTKSTRSIRSVTRSDHGHKVDPREVDRLANDLQRLAKTPTHNSNSGYEQQTKHYGMI